MHLCLPLALLLAGLLCLGEHLPPSRKAANRQPYHLHVSSTRSTTRARRPLPPPLSQPIEQQLSTRVKEKSAMIQDRSVSASTEITKSGNKEKASRRGHTLSYRNLNAAIAQHREENKEASIPGPSGMAIVKQANTGQTRPRQQFYDSSNTPTTIHDVLASEPDYQPCSCHREKGDGLIVNCTGRALSHVPGTLPIEATQLLMANNNLSDLGAGNFSRFYRLHVLDLSVNVISNLSRETFLGLSSLRVLHLHGNRLRYTADVFTAEVLVPLGSLRHLTLHNNTADMAEDLDYPDLALSRLPLLETLSLDGLTNRNFGRGFVHLNNLGTLTLSGMQGFCQMETLAHNTFQNFPSLRYLSIVKCNLQEIQTGAFIPLQSMEILDVSKNYQLGFDGASPAIYGLQNSSIRVLYANEIYSHFSSCIILTRKHLQYFQNTNIEEVHIEENGIESVERSALLAFSNNVKKVFARGNVFKFGPYWLDLLALKQLEVLHLGMYDEVPALPKSLQYTFEDANNCRAESGRKTYGQISEDNLPPICETAKTVDVISMREDSFREFVFNLPPKLTELRFRGRMLRYNLNPFSFSPNNSLQILDASINMLKVWVGPIKNLNKLKHLNVSQTYASVIRPSISVGLSNLETLDVSHNFIGEAMSRNGSKAFFDPLKSLRYLNMSFTGLYSLQMDLFQGLRSLVNVNLAGNKIRADDFMVDLSVMSNLSYIDLSWNSFEKLSWNTRLRIEELTGKRNSSLTVDLRNNPLACTCGNLDFLRWLREAHVQLAHSQEQQCIYENASHVLLWAGLEELEASCGERGLLFAGSALAFLFLCVVLIGLVLYRFRWKLRYLYYVSRGRYLKEQVAREDFRYDVFLSYATEDYEWVTGPLLAHLEKQGLRVCIHQRDFLPGRPIAANIVEAVQTSRRTVCVLSQNFLDSQWCLYEMQMAIMEGVHSRRDVLLLLVYEHVSPRALPREVLHYYQTDSYLEYPRDARCLPYFWENLTLGLR